MKQFALCLMVWLCASCAPTSSVVVTGKQSVKRSVEEIQNLKIQLMKKQVRILFLEQIETNLSAAVQLENFGVYEVVSYAGIVSLKKKRWYQRGHKRYKIVTVYWPEAGDHSTWQILSWSLDSKGKPRPIEADKVKRSRRYTAKRQIRGYWRALKRKCK